MYSEGKIQQQERRSSIEVRIEDLQTQPTLCYKQLKLGRGGAAVRCNSAKICSNLAAQHSWGQWRSSGPHSPPYLSPLHLTLADNGYKGAKSRKRKGPRPSFQALITAARSSKYKKRRRASGNNEEHLWLSHLSSLQSHITDPNVRPGPLITFPPPTLAPDIYRIQDTCAVMTEIMAAWASYGQLGPNKTRF